MRAALVVLVLAAPVAAADPTPEQVFEKRILPIFNSPNPSSCVQCHLAGVDLKNYIRPSHRETFLSLRDQGLIDLDAPEKSHILALIDRGKEDAGAKLVHKDARKAEYEAFAAWVKAGAADPALRTAPKLDADKLAKPSRPDAVIRHARTDRVLESFTNTVWAMRFRCAGCHTPAGAADRLKQKPGEKHPADMTWLKPTADETLAALTRSRLVNAKKPEQSLLLLKPLAEEVEHGGGVKFLRGDQGHKAVRRFLDDYAAVVGDRYATASDLPPRPAVEAFGTPIWFKIQNTPPAWADEYVAVKLFAWDAARGAWEPDPIAETDRKVWGEGKLWQHSLTLLAARGSDRAKAWRAGQPSLPRGAYLVKVYVDAGGRLAKDWTAELTEADYVGRAEVRSAWPAGYGRMTVLDAGRVRKE